MESTLTKIIRVLAGLLLLVGGLNKFFPLMANPPHNEAGTAFLTALVASGFVMHLVALIEIGSGLCFVSGRFVALAAVLFAPVAVNIVCFHLMLDSASMGPGLFVGIADAYLLAVNLPKYQDLLMPR